MILALIAFPEAQRKAHEELDKVIGSDRAPEWEDLDDLPYMRALVNEVHRFRPIAPLIPRYATADCEVGVQFHKIGRTNHQLCYSFSIAVGRYQRIPA